MGGGYYEDKPLVISTNVTIIPLCPCLHRSHSGMGKGGGYKGGWKAFGELIAHESICGWLVNAGLTRIGIDAFCWLHRIAAMHSIDLVISTILCAIFWFRLWQCNRQGCPKFSSSTETTCPASKSLEIVENAGPRPFCTVRCIHPCDCSYPSSSSH